MYFEEATECYFYEKPSTADALSENVGDPCQITDKNRDASYGIFDVDPIKLQFNPPFFHNLS